MKLSIFQAVLGTSALFIAGCDAGSSHRHLHQPYKRLGLSHGHVHSRAESNALVKRGTCAFPTDDPNLVAVTPESKNAGWAMSPDQECKPGNYCPIACKAGMVMAQWDPKSTYTYPASMNGGLYCDKDGNVKKPFPNKPNCVKGTGSVKAVNKCKSKMSWCQTVLPGNEAMLIPTLVSSEATIAVPDSSYWESTAAHFYINPPGTGEEGCVWGTSSTAIGNWSPFVAGANTDGSGQTFVKIGFNPIWQASNLAGSKPNFGVKIECPDGGCNGLPCQIDPSSSSNSAVGSKLAAVGAGNAAFCVVTVSKGSTAHIVAFDGSGGNSDPGPEAPKKSSSAPPPPPLPPPSTTSQQPTTSKAPTTTSAASTTSTTTSSILKPTTTSSVVVSTTTSSSELSSTSDLTTSSSSATPTLLPGGIFHENGTSPDNRLTTSSSSPSVPAAQTTAPGSPPLMTTEKKGEAYRQQGGAVAGLLVAFVAAACLL
ncbi:hypothetical protein QQS21_010325 [Conoideocrella luteorostrata]|uniref:Uncharacterized protein n=1 Tax=Conoideocrella luteorostrata TaxID=1105319 RepID=A0AAJ0FUB1_9HYPO|nr:hypothetical protein QQS21_010325 [Conoideocrella luteorostrata]